MATFGAVRERERALLLLSIGLGEVFFHFIIPLSPPSFTNLRFLSAPDGPQLPFDSPHARFHKTSSRFLWSLPQICGFSLQETEGAQYDFRGIYWQRNALNRGRREEEEEGRLENCQKWTSLIGTASLLLWEHSGFDINLI